MTEKILISEHGYPSANPGDNFHETGWRMNEADRRLTQRICELHKLYAGLYETESKMVDDYDPIRHRLENLMHHHQRAALLTQAITDEADIIEETEKARNR